MVLLVPPLLEELGADGKGTSRQALATWQRKLWSAAQRLRSSDEAEPRWMGTLEQLSSVVAGSVVLGGSEDAPDVIPLPSEALPVVKGSPADPLVRLEGPSGMSGRYAQLSVVIGSSVGIWPAVISVAGGGGENSRRLRGRGGQSVRLQVVSHSNSRLGFRLVDAETGAVIVTSDKVEEVAMQVEDGPRPVPWAAFLEGCLWGLPATVPAPRDSASVAANGPQMRAMAALWGLNPQLHEPRVPLLALTAFMAAATELPEARATANEIAVHWEALTFSGDQLCEAVEQALQLMISAANTPAVLSAAAPARALGAVSAAIYMGEVLRNSVSTGASTTGAQTRAAALDSPRARRSLTGSAGGSTFLTRATPTASPARAQQSPRATPSRGVDSDSDDVMSPESMRKELKRLRQRERQVAGGEAGRDRRVTPRPGIETQGAAPALPPSLVDAPGATPLVRADRGAVEVRRGGSDGDAGLDQATTMSAGHTMGSYMRLPNMAEIKRLIPASADDTPLVELSARLSRGGFPGAPAAFAQAVSAVATGIVPVVGSALEAEMLADHMATVLDDLVLAKALPDGHPAFEGGTRPADWVQAAERGRALILAAARTFRTARRVALADSTAEGGGTSGAKQDKVPDDAYVKVHEASTNSLKILAASAGVINPLTTDAVLRGERLRGSKFETLTGHTRTELDAALQGELDYFVGMYGQAATAFLVSNSRTIDEVSGKGVPAALAGVRQHLWLRALRWVNNVYGERRATRRKADVEKLALSLMTGAIPAVPVGTEGEKLIIELLGGSKPHKGAEVEREGGSLDAGTTGKLTGETAQFAVRVAYRRWAKGLARCMGEVLSAARGRAVSKEAVLGQEGDFGVESAFQNVSEDMPAERLRSIGRYLLEELHVACGWHRAEPGNALPDVLAIVEEMGGDVFKYRRQEHQLETLAIAAAAKVADTFSERLKAVEAKHGGGAAGKADYKKAAVPKGVASTSGAKPYEARKSDEKQTTQPKQGTKKFGKQPAEAAGVEMDDGALAMTAKRAAKALEESMQKEDEGPFDTRVKAVAALQAAYRTSVLGVAPSRRMFEKEPCAWMALGGRCKDKRCKPCTSGLTFSAEMVESVRAKCNPGLFDGGKAPAVKEPG